ncbi:MAG TPA: PDZ domain-containing protein, partial [Firmicutes bacterium]|nr:PDZ domain-containing protein [Bacillota bacterium]
MKKKISVGAALGIAGITAVVVFFATSFAQLNMIGALTNNAWYQEPLYQKIHAIEQIVEKQFDGEIEEKQLMDYVSRGYMAGLGDRFSLYFSKEDLEEFLISEAGELVGIGVTGIQDPETGYIRVESVYKGSPADLAGLRAGDLLTAVDGTGVLEVGYEEAINQIRGEEGTSVSLTFLRDGAEQDLHIVRQKIEVPSVSYQLYGDNGYIAVTSFNETTARQFQQAVESLQAQGAEKLIFDMRN